MTDFVLRITISLWSRKLLVDFRELDIFNTLKYYLYLDAFYNFVTTGD